MLIQSLHPLSPLVTHSSLLSTEQLSGSRNQIPGKLSAQIIRGLTSEKLHFIIRQMEKLFMPLRTNITWEENSLSSFAVRAEIKSSCKGNYLHIAGLTHVSASQMLFFCHLQFLQLHFYCSSLQRPNKLLCLGLSRDSCSISSLCWYTRKHNP